MRFSKIKHFIAEIIEPKHKAGPLSIVYNILLSIIVITSCAFIFVELFVPHGNVLHDVAFIVEIVAVSSFFLEYMLKLFVSEVLFPGLGWFKSKVYFFTSFDSVVDIICLSSALLILIPEEFKMLQMLKLIKLARLTKLKYSFDEVKEGFDAEPSPKKGLRHRVYEIINKAHKGDALSKTYDVVSIVIVFLSTSILILDIFPFPDVVKNILFISEIVFTIFFATDYNLRVWTANFTYPHIDKDHAKTRYLFSFNAIIDFISIVPLFFMFFAEARAAYPEAVAVLKIFALLRIARLLKLSRYFKGVNNFITAIKNKRKPILISVLILAVLSFISSVLIYVFESGAGNPDIRNIVYGIYYAITFITSIGEASISLISLGGRIMFIIMMSANVCLFAIPLGIAIGECSKKKVKAHKQIASDSNDN